MGGLQSQKFHNEGMQSGQACAARIMNSPTGPESAVPLPEATQPRGSVTRRGPTVSAQHHWVQQCKLDLVHRIYSRYRYSTPASVDANGRRSPIIPPPHQAARR